VMNNFISNNLTTGSFDGPDIIGASSGGGGIWVDSHSTPTIVQNVVVNNEADIGVGVYLAAPVGILGPSLINNTIAGNQTTREVGSELYTEGGSLTELFNNLLISFLPQNAVFCGRGVSELAAGVPVFENNDPYSQKAADLEGSCGLRVGVKGNISGNPLFEDTAAGDYRLLKGSPVIDAGLNSAPHIPARDFYGKPRFYAGKPGDAAIVDIGAAEYQPGESVPTPTPTPSGTAE
jgi:hypothetical protein